MLKSITRILAFIAAIAGLTFAAGYLAESEGGLRIILAEKEYSLGPLAAVVLLVCLVVALWITFKVLGLIGAFIRFVNGDETALSRYFARNRERRGFEALADGMTALASGEGRSAMAHAARAERYLGRPELTNLISAQAAEMNGDHKKSVEIYKRLLKDDRTRFVGIRGLMKQYLAQGETDIAMELAKKAFVLKPAHVETGDILLQLQAENEDWEGARKTIAKKQQQGALPRDVYRRRDAVLALSEAKSVFKSGTPIEKREAAIEANRLSPDLVPAAVMAAQNYILEGRSNYAVRVLKKAWSAQPHPDLAAAFASIVPEESPADRLKRFKPILKILPDHPETKMLNAELNIAAGNFEDARESVTKLADEHPTTRSLTIMAAIERGQGSRDEIVRAWLAKAVTASRGPQWTCTNCQTVHANWEPVCSNCKAFDTLAWQEPKQDEANLGSSADMLPLIIGGPEPDVVEDEEPDFDESIGRDVDYVEAEVLETSDNPGTQDSTDEPAKT